MTTAFVRTVLLYLILMAGLRLMGKRQIGELEPNELVLTLIIADLAAVPMQDFGIPLVNGLFPIITLLSLSMLFSYCSMRSLRLRQLLCGHPTVVIRNGKLLQDSMKQNRLTVDELLEQLRLQGYADLSAVKYAILETSGKLSVFPYTQDAPVTPQVMGLTPTDSATLPMLIISDGRILHHNLKASGRDLNWVKRELKNQGLASAQKAFLMTVDESGTVVCIEKETQQ